MQVLLALRVDSHAIVVLNIDESDSTKKNDLEF